MTAKRDITNLLGMQYPIIQAPMFGASTAEMVAASNAAGCLGTLALGSLPPESCLELIEATRKLTKSIFAVNIFSHTIPEKTPELERKYSEVRNFLISSARHVGIDVELPRISELKIVRFRDQIETIIRSKCPILSFTFGMLDNPTLAELKNHNVKLLGTANSLREAQLLNEAGVDCIVVQGLEAGGHRGSFHDENIPLIGGLSLLTRIRHAIERPLVYAGGIHDGAGYRAARDLGADGIQIGSILLGSKESAFTSAEKARIQTATEDDIVLTRAFTGRYARGIATSLSKALEARDMILPYPYQNLLTGPLRRAAKKAGNTEFTSLWMGQTIFPFSEESTTDVLSHLLEEIQAPLKKVG